MGIRIIQCNACLLERLKHLADTCHMRGAEGCCLAEAKPAVALSDDPLYDHPTREFNPLALPRGVVEVDATRVLREWDDSALLFCQTCIWMNTRLGYGFPLRSHVRGRAVGLRPW